MNLAHANVELLSAIAPLIQDLPATYPNKRISFRNTFQRME